MDNVRIVEEGRDSFGVCPAEESVLGVPHVRLKPTSTTHSTTFNSGMASSTSLLPSGTKDI
jgi:hypothetical protein